MHRSRPSGGTILCSIAILVLTVSRPSLAQNDLLPGETIRDRDRPELETPGIPVNSFRLRPSVDLSASYDSNIYALRDNEIEDWIAIIAPRLELASDWGRHFLRIVADGRFMRFSENSSEDHNNHSATAELGLDLTTHSRLGFSASTALTHDDRESPDDAGGIEPTPIDRDFFSADYTLAGPRRFGMRMRVSSETLDFGDVEGTNGIINNDDRDRTSTIAELRLAYAINERLDFLLQGRSDDREYDLPPGDPRLDRSSDGYVAGLGLAGALSGKLFSDAIVGTTSRKYESSALVDTESELWYSVRLVWNPSGLTSFTINADRNVEETIVAGASGRIASSYDFRIDHELRRNVLLYAVLTTETRDYQGIDRKDDVRRFDLGARYMINRNFQIDLDLRSMNRDSAPEEWADDSFDKIVGTLTARLRF